MLNLQKFNKPTCTVMSTSLLKVLMILIQVKIICTIHKSDSLPLDELKNWCLNMISSMPEALYEVFIAALVVGTALQETAN